MKFKVGDRVRRVSDDCPGLNIGDIGKIIEVSPYGTYIVINERNGDTQAWAESFIEAAKTTQTIVIYQKDLETIATLKEGKKVIRTATAKCNPEDIYEFEIGAKLAFSRLMGIELVNTIQKQLLEEVRAGEQFDWDGFKQGKFAVHCDTEEKAREFLKECDTQGIKWSSGEKPSERFYFITSCPCYHYNKSLYHDSKKYCECELKLQIIDYQPKQTKAKAVKRPAKVGEWIKIVDGAGCTLTKAGDIAQVTDVWVNNDGVDYTTTSGIEGSGWHCRYVVLENYHPEEKPQKTPLSEYTMHEIATEILRRYQNGIHS